VPERRRGRRRVSPRPAGDSRVRGDARASPGRPRGGAGGGAGGGGGAAAGGVERRPGRWEWTFDRRVLLHPPIDPWPFLGSLLCPALVVRGDGSALMSRDQMLRVAAAVRQGRFIEVKQAY